LCPIFWIAVEMSSKGVLVYGSRVSLLTRSQKSFASYEALMGAYTLSKKGTSSMEKVLPLMEES